jgi:hypothetical protein
MVSCGDFVVKSVVKRGSWMAVFQAREFVTLFELFCGKRKRFSVEAQPKRKTPER